MSLGGGGYGGEGLPYPSKVLQLWGGELEQAKVPTPAAPTFVRDDGSGRHDYAIVALSAQGDRTPASPTVKAGGRSPRCNGTASPAPTPTLSFAMASR